MLWCVCVCVRARARARARSCSCSCSRIPPQHTSRHACALVVAGQGYADWEWQENGDLMTTTALQPGLAVDPRTKQTLFFNSVVAAFVGYAARAHTTHCTSLHHNTPQHTTTHRNTPKYTTARYNNNTPYRTNTYVPCSGFVCFRWKDKRNDPRKAVMLGSR